MIYFNVFKCKNKVIIFEVHTKSAEQYELVSLFFHRKVYTFQCFIDSQLLDKASLRSNLKKTAYFRPTMGQEHFIYETSQFI